MHYQLYLVRHGEAESHHLLRDHQRSLTPVGQQEAAKVGQFLQQQSVVPACILHSDAVRTTMTAEIIAAHMQPQPFLQANPLLYNAHHDTWLQVIHELPLTVNNIIIVGHNVGISEFARHLYGNYLPDLQTCGVYGFELSDWLHTHTGEGNLILRL